MYNWMPWAPPSPSRADSSPVVDHAGMSSDEIAAHMSKHAAGAAGAGDSDSQAGSGGGGGGCPVDHENMSKEEISAFMAQHRANSSNSAKEATDTPLAPSSPPPSEATAPPATVYDVYGQKLDPSNMMPATPNQLPSPGQQSRLSTERVPSTIPKSETGMTWTYPSPQMFYNALKRKGKADDVEEADMDSVVAIHNTMNEGTWEKVLDWERRFHCDECPDPKLRRFRGRPHDLSPAARFRTMFRGYPAPFDRHDWVVDRCGKKDVRYVIDYYYRETAQGEPIELHVRPAADSVGAVWDRFRLNAFKFQDALFPSPGNGDMSADAIAPGGGAGPAVASAAAAVAKGTDAPVGDAEFEFLSSLTPEKIDSISEDVRKKCAKVGLELAQSKGDPAAYEKANVALNYCMATKICKTQAASFLDALENKPGSEAEPFVAMTSCLDRFHVMARRVMSQASGVPQSGPEAT